jgi:multidrug efflux pump
MRTGGRLHAQAARGAEHGGRAGLQLLGPGAERRLLAFVTLKDWSERKGAEHSAQALAGRAFGALMGIRDAFIFPLSPPPIP